MCSKTVVFIVTAALGVTGCATKSYVDRNIVGLSSRLDQQGQRIDELEITSRAALVRAEEAGALARGKFLYKVILTSRDVTFETDQSALSDQARLRLSELAEKLQTDNRHVYLEIQGHTDATGTAGYNRQLGLQRAESVRRYLHTQGVSLNRMSSISYGEDTPVESNNTREGRAVNRRVEIVVME